MADISSLPIAVQAQAAQAALNATDISVKRVEASTPDIPWETYAPLIGKVATLLLGGFLIKWGIDLNAWTNEQWGLVVGSAVSLAGIVLAWNGRRVAAKREHQIALASAAASAAATQAEGKPVEVPVQPPPAKV